MEGRHFNVLGKLKLDSNQAMYLPNHQALCTNVPGRIVTTDRIEKAKATISPVPFYYSILIPKYRGGGGGDDDFTRKYTNS